MKHINITKEAEEYLVSIEEDVKNKKKGDK